MKPHRSVFAPDLVLILLPGFLGPACHRADPGVAPQEPAHAEAHELAALTLEFDAQQLATMGLEFAVPERAEWVPEVRAFGRVLSQPSAVATLRAPLAGTLLAGDVQPALGAALAAGQVVFRLAPRLTPVERRGLATERATSAAELAALEAELPQLRVEAERARGLNQDKTVSDRDLGAAEARLQAAEARASGMRELVRTLAAAAADEAGTALALVLPAAGEVTELDARAGEAVEAGAVLLRAEDFRAPLVSIDLPAGAGAASAIRAARVERVDAPGEFLAAERIGPAPSATGAAPALFFQVRAEAGATASLRPGLGLSAWLRLDQPALTGVRVPASAVVRLAGQAFVYVRRGATTLERVALALERPLSGGWFADEAWLPGERPELVVHGAQQVLSAELLGRQGTEED